MFHDASSAILRESLGRFEQTQLEYWRFYITPEWRAARLAVIERHGPICKSCTQLASLFDAAMVGTRIHFSEAEGLRLLDDKTAFATACLQ